MAEKFRMRRFVLFEIAVFFLANIGTAHSFPQAEKKQDQPLRTLTISFENCTEQTVYGNTLRMGNLIMGVPNLPPQTDSIRGDSGRVYLREMLGSEDIHFMQYDHTISWWNEEGGFRPGQSKKGKIPQSQKLYSQGFLDPRCLHWKVHYSLHPSGRWLKMSHGLGRVPWEETDLRLQGLRITELCNEFNKPADFKDFSDEELRSSKVVDYYRMIAFQFENQSGKEVFLPVSNPTLIRPDIEEEVILSAQFSNTDEQFLNNDNKIGCSAQIPEESIYRPVAGSRIRIKWEVSGKQQEQLIEIPEFDRAQLWWVCHFTLNADNQWSAKFHSGKK